MSWSLRSRRVTFRTITELLVFYEWDRALWVDSNGICYKCSWASWERTTTELNHLLPLWPKTSRSPGRSCGFGWIAKAWRSGQVPWGTSTAWVRDEVRVDYARRWGGEQGDEGWGRQSCSWTWQWWIRPWAGEILPRRCPPSQYYSIICKLYSSTSNISVNIPSDHLNRLGNRSSNLLIRQKCRLVAV